MADNKLNFVFDGDNSGFSAALKGVQDKLKDVGNQMKDFGSTMSTYVSLPLAALGIGAIKAYGDLQSLKMGLTAVMGSADAASAELVKLKEVAKLPGLGLKEAAQGSVALQAAGFSADEARKSLTSFGNALATVGKGKRELDLVTLALTQLNNKQSGYGQDLRQLTEQLPQLRNALTDAFGTADTEKISKMGITGHEVVTRLTSEFEKLPKVTGGINNAFENMSDSIFNSFASVGEIIDKNFNITGIIDKVADSISSIVEWFKSLSPEVQNAALVFGGLLIVIPPIIAALGVFIGTILPALMTGFAALTSPITLVVVAIGAAAYAIYKNWDAIKEYFVSGDGSSFFNAVVSYATDLWQSLKSIFNTLKTFVIGVWNSIGTNIIGYVKGAFSVIQGVISTVLGVISGYVKVFSSIIKGDWSGVWEGIKQIAVSLWNGILAVIKGGVMQVGNVLAGFFKLIGADNLAKGFEDANKRIAKGFDFLTIPVKKATETIKDFNKEIAKADVPTNKKTTKEKTLGGDSDGKDKIADVYKDLSISLKQIDADLGKTFEEKSIKRIAEYQQAINGLIKNGVNPLSASIKELQKLQGESGLGGAKVAGNNALATDPKVKPSAKIALPAIQTNTLSEGMKQAMDIANQFNTQFSNMVSDGLAGGIGDAFNAVGEAFASGGNVLEALGSSLLGSFGKFLSSFGDMLLQYGIAALVKAKLDIAIAVPGAGLFAAPLAIAAGIALKIAGAAFKGLAGGGKQKAFAKGGIVSSPTNAIFGEYSNAGRGNPEVVAPLNSLKSMLGESSSNGGQVYFEIQGDKLVGVLNNHNKRQYRTT